MTAPETSVERPDPVAALTGFGVATAASVTTRCAHCPDTFAGTIEEGRAWFAAHRAEAHSDLPAPRERPRRRGL